jgi:hypothetical protein
MSKLLYVGGFLALIAVLAIPFMGRETVILNQAPEVIEKTVEVEVPELEKKIKQAIAASSTEIAADAQKAYEERETFLKKQIELEVTRAYRAEIEKRETQLEKETGEY